jgi:hypothetical protein
MKRGLVRWSPVSDDPAESHDVCASALRCSPYLAPMSPVISSCTPRMLATVITVNEPRRTIGSGELFQCSCVWNHSASPCIQDCCRAYPFPKRARQSMISWSLLPAMAPSFFVKTRVCSSPFVSAWLACSFRATRHRGCGDDAAHQPRRLFGSPRNDLRDHARVFGLCLSTVYPTSPNEPCPHLLPEPTKRGCVPEWLSERAGPVFKVSLGKGPQGWT